MLANVSEREGTEDGIAEGVDGHVSVGMGYEAVSVGYVCSAKTHTEAFSQCVHVIPVSYSDIIWFHVRKDSINI